MIGIGPYSLSVLIALAAVFVTWAVAYTLGRQRPDVNLKTMERIVLESVFWGAVAARVGYILLWWEAYTSAPLSMISVSDGGFIWWAGCLAALTWTVWRTRQQLALRRPVLIAITTGMLCWFGAKSVLPLIQGPGLTLPALVLETLDQRPISLRSYTGRPVILNLWSSWCPPCRREMPVFQEAQAQYPNVAFVMFNQGEDLGQARSFLNSKALAFNDVLLDPNSLASRVRNVPGLPTTLFFDAQGRLVDTHLGELNMPSLKSTISRHFTSVHSN